MDQIEFFADATQVATGLSRCQVSCHERGETPPTPSVRKHLFLPGRRLRFMGYSVENCKAVYYHEPRHPGQPGVVLKLADLNTFVILNRVWAKDRGRVWAHGALVGKAFAPAFEALNAAFGRDNECVYESLRGRVVEGVNAAAFEVLDDGVMGFSSSIVKEASYARCEGKVYHYESLEHKTAWLRGADATSFRALKWTFGCDVRRVYCRNRPLNGARPETFRQITPFFSTDGRTVYYFAEPVAGADPATFRPFGADFWENPNPTPQELRGRNDRWAKDKNHIYDQHLVMEGLDPATAKLAGRMLKDATQVYAGYRNQVEGADACSFEPVPGSFSYYRDRRRVYCGTKPVEGADPASFEALPVRHPSKGDGWDVNWIYQSHERWKPRSQFHD